MHLDFVLQTMISMMLLSKVFRSGAKSMLGLIQKIMCSHIALIITKKVGMKLRWMMGKLSKEREKRDQLVAVQKIYQGRHYLSTSICQ